MPSNFLTRYNTTENTCECPDKHWIPINYPDTPDQQCKHIKVYRDPSVWRYWMTPYIPYSNVTVRPPNDDRFASIFAEYLFSHQKRLYPMITVEKIVEWKRSHLQLSSKIYNSDILNYIKWFKGFHNIELYNTTETSCDCLAFRYSSDGNCKHIRALLSQKPPPPPPVTPLETQEPSLVSSVEDFNKQLELLNEEKAALEKEKEEYTDALGLCLLCYTNKKIGCCDTCNKGMCVDCWRNIERRCSWKKPSCPWCRTPTEPLVDVLIKKFKEFSV